MTIWATALCAVQFDPDEWGTVAEWVAAIGTAGAFAATVLLLRTEARARRAAEAYRRSEQARLVAAWPTSVTEAQPENEYGNAVEDGVTVAWHNRSEEPVSDVVIVIDGQPEDHLEVLPPGITGGRSYRTPPATSARWPSIEIHFIDAAGQLWRRDAAGRLILTPASRSSASPQSVLRMTRNVQH